jgi:putative DNA primase/helicase
MRCNAIITDENDVGTFIDKAANLKAIATNDVIQINRKFLKPVAFQFWGLNVQCLNELPRMKDKSASNDRRHLFVPFEKSFTGRERKYIKDDYLKRPEVLEYVLWYALNRAGAANAGKYYEFSEPPATKAVLAEYKEYNDPVRAFWNEFRIKFNWDLLPFPFLYDLFKSWFAEQNPTGSVLSSQKFSADLLAVLESDETWHCKDKRLKIRPGSMMDAVEPLIAEYDLKKWMHPYYDGKDVNKRCRPELSASYRGVQRYTVGPTPGETTEEAIARLEAQNAALKAGSRTDDEKKN